MKHSGPLRFAYNFTNGVNQFASVIGPFQRRRVPEQKNLMHIQRMETAEGVIVGWYIFLNQKCHQKWRKSRNDSKEKRRSNIRRRSLLRVRLRSQHIRCFRLPFQPHFRFHQGTRAPRRFPRESRNIPFPSAAAP